ncbi:Metallo-dependent hydrolase [Jackrogersella minutella]|nr:Metallo-dependent hydrolase [Jackrogersella minutella]
MKINNVVLPCQTTGINTSRRDIHVEDGKVRQMRPSDYAASGSPKLLLPPLSQPDYSDIVPQTGSFDEALSNTSKAKERYTEEDLYLRGSQLLETSYEQGVTSLRAFVELDHVTGSLPLTTAIRLKADFSHLLNMQLCAFAQDPLFSTTHGEANRSIISSLLEEHASSIQVLGTTPYVEELREVSLQNVEWAITTALRYRLHLDFHLDYYLKLPSISSQPLTFSVIELLKKHDWLRIADNSKTIVLGHCTQLTVLCDSDLQQLAENIIHSGLPIHFVGLPTSDMFMMGRSSSIANAMQARPRGTLHVPSMVKDLGLSACIGVNNVGNAFTPYGSGDPLQVASWGVGNYQTGTAADAMMLPGCVSWLARGAISLGGSTANNDVIEGRSLPGMLLIENKDHIKLPSIANGSGLKIPAKQRTCVKDIVWDPPEIILRSVIR